VLALSAGLGCFVPEGVSAELARDEVLTSAVKHKVGVVMISEGVDVFDSSENIKSGFPTLSVTERSQVTEESAIGAIPRSSATQRERDSAPLPQLIV